MTEHDLPAIPSTAFRGAGYCHVPGEEAIDVERLAESDGDDDRWNDPGEPTVYLALDPGVALAELARHLPPPPARRRLVRFDLDLPGIVDLRSRAVRAAAGHRGPVTDLLDLDLTRRLARSIRQQSVARGLLVPSVAFADEPDRGSVVLFAERLPAGIAAAVGRPVVVGSVEVDCDD